MVIKLRVVQFWSEIILVISNRTRATRSFNFEITRMISDQIALHSVQLPLFIPLISIIRYEISAFTILCSLANSLSLKQYRRVFLVDSVVSVYSLVFTLYFL